MTRLTGIPFDDTTFAARRLSQLCDDIERLEDDYYNKRISPKERRAIREEIDALNKAITSVANFVASEARP